MADTNKSIQINMNVVVSQAKQAMADLASQTKATTDQMSKFGTSAQSSANVTNKAMQTATKSSGGFFGSLQKDIVSSLAAYDLFKKGVQMVGGFLESSIQESIKASATMAQVKVNVQNAGLAYEKISPQLDEYSKKQIQMGFDDEATALSVSKLMLITGDYNKALKLNQLAMDLSRSKGIDLETATKAIALVTQGNIKALKEYGIELGESATISDVLNEAQQKLSGSAKAYSETIAGKMDIVKQQWDNIKQAVGDRLQPTMITLFDTLEKNLPEITSMFEGLGTAVTKTVDAMVIVGGGLSGLFNIVSAGWGAIEGVEVSSFGHIGKAGAELGGQSTKLSQSIIDFGNTMIDVSQNKINKTIDKSSTLKNSFDDLFGSTQNVTGVTVALGNEVNKTTGKIEAGGKASKEQTQAQKDHVQAMKDLSQSFIDVTAKQDQFTFKSEADFGKFSTLLQDTKMKQNDWITSAKQGFTAYSQAVKDIETDIKSLDDKIAAAKKTMDDFTKSTNKSSGDSFAQIVHDAKKSIPDLQKQLSEAMAGGQDTTDIQKQLNDANAIITESQKTQYNDGSALAIEYHAQLALLEKQDSENALQIAYETMQQKIADKQAETDAMILQYESQKKADTDALVVFQSNQKIMTDTFAASVKIRGATAKAEIISMDAITASVNAATAAYLRMNAARNNQPVTTITYPTPNGQPIPGKAVGGPVSQVLFFQGSR